jgi:mannitol-1-phosphate/altronate dehydrogenase
MRLVGLGFGAIQAGLFVYEAQRTGAYAPPLVIDVRADLVAGIRAAGGRCRVNIARADRIDVAEIGPLAVADATVAGDRARIIDAIAEADELAIALPSVAHYRSDSPASPHTMLAEAIARRTRTRPLVVYCAENHRNATAVLAGVVAEALGPGRRDLQRSRVRLVDTVIGKMSGVVTDPAEIEALGLVTVTPELPWAFLVEEFDRILVSRLDAGHPQADGAESLHPGIPVLREVDDLAPFEDAKLLGHNATHALAGFLGSLLGLRLVADLVEVPGAMAFLRAAFIEESGRALIVRHAGADELFTRTGYAAFADDLLARMVNPYLADTIERAARDPLRKLAWDDRLTALLRLGLAAEVMMPRFAMGVAAGVEILRRDDPDGGVDDLERLRRCWPRDLDDAEASAVLAVVAEGIERLSRWRRDGFEGLALDR